MSFIRDIYYILKPFFSRATNYKIIVFAIVICVVLEFVGVGLGVWLNYWYIDFYDSLANYNQQLLIHQIIVFIFIMLFTLVNTFVAYLIGQVVVIKIRQYLTIYYTKRWVQTKPYLQMYNCDNPDERISNDIKQFITLLKTLSLGFIASVPTFVVFSAILWSLSGSFELKVLGYEIKVYGYLFWFALILAGINIIAIIKVGKPLRKLVYDKQRYEANFRFGLAELRINNDYENNSKIFELKKHFSNVVDNFYQLTFREIKINVVTNFFSQIYGIIGIFLSLPRYFLKAISFGQVMQINSAFLKVVTPLLFFVYSYEQVAELKANVKRLKELVKQIDRSEIND
ncbi:SbmA/BacA-like family transporter [Candidatus Francisella endociliophora]|uniref:SbmA/BacA-like family transporter n=1 Tax=Candidatus Francisella endociliophora TaxID=653937 RepID=UPI000694F950|nr:SbmA/BacA-like family transporter [Francisella sp. FSC1006]